HRSSAPLNVGVGMTSTPNGQGQSQFEWKSFVTCLTEAQSLARSLHDRRERRYTVDRGPWARLRCAIGPLGLSRPAEMALALCAACALGSADRLVASPVALLVVSRARSNGGRESRRGAMVRAPVTLSPRPVSDRRHRHAGRRLHL